MKKAFNIKKFSKYLLSFWGYFFLAVLDGKYSPFPLALLVANLYVGLKPLPSLILYTVAFFPSFSLSAISLGFFGGFTICTAFSVYKKLGKKPSLEIALFSAIGLFPYCYFSLSHALAIKLIISASIVLSSFIMISGAKIWLVKGLKFKLDANDLCSAVFLFVCIAYGSIIAFGEGFYFVFAVFILLFTSLFIKGYSPMLIGALVSLPIAFFRWSLEPVAVFTVYALAVSLAGSFSKLFNVILFATVTCCFYFFTDYFTPLLPYSPFFSFISLSAYLFFPQRVYEKWEHSLCIHRLDNVGKVSINMHRNLLSAKLYEMSAVFDEMKRSIASIKSPSTEKERFIPLIADEILVAQCSACQSYADCKKMRPTVSDGLEKIVELAIAKGSLKLVDMPKSFSSRCDYQEEIASLANSLVQKYFHSVEENDALCQGRELIVKQTEGLSFALKELAVDLGKQLFTDQKEEDKIKANLLKCGIPVKEIASFKGGQEEIVVVLYQEYVSHPLLLKAISEITGYKSVISTNNRLSEELSAITVKRAPSLDATFGISNKIKFDKQKSGDTHSIIKISEGKFLIALNDGMGSGDRAEEISATAISLVETFYKAGIKSETVLPTVNKILAFGEEDNFTALDVAVVDLFNSTADFVKIGSPYSFILTKDTVKIIEGNSLPLGIIEDIKPTVCKTDLSVGDVIVFVSDGITDAFESSADLIDFLSSQKALNPKTLADNILERALYLSEGIAKDDMTVFCVRIFKSAS